MRQADVMIGHEYTARVSGQRVTVRVLARSNRDYDRRQWICLNLRTGAEVRKSSAQLSPLPQDRPVVLSPRSRELLEQLVGDVARETGYPTMDAVSVAIRARWPHVTGRLIDAAVEHARGYIAAMSA